MKPAAVSAEPTAEQIGTVLEAPPTNLVMAQEDGEREREETGARIRQPGLSFSFADSVGVHLQCYDCTHTGGHQLRHHTQLHQWADGDDDKGGGREGKPLPSCQQRLDNCCIQQAGKASLQR